jgi:hypothetical protein
MKEQGACQQWLPVFRPEESVGVIVTFFTKMNDRGNKDIFIIMSRILLTKFAMPVRYLIGILSKYLYL